MGAAFCVLSVYVLMIVTAASVAIFTDLKARRSAAMAVLRLLLWRRRR
jgi:hypothetical protein